MTYVDWRITGPSFTTCNCDWGCPCQFNAHPTQGHCRAAVGMHIDKGHFGDTILDGLCWVVLVAWPGAIHEGNGEAQPIIDKRADEAQRAALLAILSGQETEPGATIFNVFATTYSLVHKPLFLPIGFEADFAAGTGHFYADSILEAAAEPIRNPVTGAEHRPRIVLPDGFEFREAEVVSGSAKCETVIDLDWMGRHGHLAMIDLTPYGQAA